jgi:hypothetical protein
MGLSYFYNAKYGATDCQLKRGQKVLEFIFGTTIVRDLKKFGALGAPSNAAPAWDEAIDPEHVQRLVSLDIGGK